MKARLELYTDAHGTLIFDKYGECSPKNHERTRHMEVWTIVCSIKPQILLFRWEVMMKTKINESFQKLYLVAAWMSKLLLWRARVPASTWYQDVDIIILLFVLKSASEEHNVIRVLCGDMEFCLPAHVLRVQNDPVHQICMQEPHCQVPSVARHAPAHWLWYDIILVRQRETFLKDFCPGLLTMYLVVLVQLMLIWWESYSL